MLPRAEALLREAAGSLQFSKHHTGQLTIVDGCHVSLAVRIAWQQSRLLAGMPKRHSEAAQWAGLARTLWRNEHRKSGPNGPPPQAQSTMGELQDEEEGEGEELELEYLVDPTASDPAIHIEQALGAFSGRGKLGTRSVMSFWLGRVFYS